MHGLIFETSIWLLAGSTRFVMITQGSPIIDRQAMNRSLMQIESFRQMRPHRGHAFRELFAIPQQTMRIMDCIPMCKCTSIAKPIDWQHPQIPIKPSTGCQMYALALLKTHSVVKQRNSTHPAKWYNRWIFPCNCWIFTCNCWICTCNCWIFPCNCWIFPCKPLFSFLWPNAF